MSLTLKFALYTLLVCFAVLAGSSYVHYRVARQDLEQALGEKLEAIVRSASVAIDGTAHDSINEMADQEGEAFTRIRDHLRKVRDANHLGDLIYTMRREGEKMKFIVMTHDKPFIGHDYEIRPEMLPTLNKGMASRTGLYEDKNGHWISAYAPLLDQEGHISGLLEADYEVDTFLAQLKNKQMRTLGLGLVFSLIAAVLSFLVAKTLTRKIVYLTDLTEKISLGKMNTGIEVRGNDEIAKLGRALERMRESLKIASDLIE
ncbi:MAG: HAMP domain-containing protein [Acidobacteria bacterium]|nr:HAMP domain-containing protein [Acidobacteriota bacterium]